MNPRIVLPSGGFFVCELLTLAIHILVTVRGKNRLNFDSAGNYNLMDEESTGRMIIPLGIATHR
jgi:hypothetical protein